MQKAIKFMVFGMGVGMLVTKCLWMPKKNDCSCSNTSTTGNDCDCENNQVTKCESLIEEFNKIDLSEVKDKTKKALEKFKQKLQSL